MLVETDSLKWLLSLMQRKQTIDGKSISQVHSLLLKAEGGRLSACTLVKERESKSRLERVLMPDECASMSNGISAVVLK